MHVYTYHTVLEPFSQDLGRLIECNFFVHQKKFKMTLASSEMCIDCVILAQKEDFKEWLSGQQ